jgi:hypothetical protein
MSIIGNRDDEMCVSDNLLVDQHEKPFESCPIEANLQNDSKHEFQFDVIVIGSGPGGE